MAKQKLRIDRVIIAIAAFLVIIFVLKFVFTFTISLFDNIKKEEKNIVEEVINDPIGVVIVDPGHGGWDKGTHTPDESVLESDITLSTSLVLKEYLESYNVKVYMTRETDTALADSKDPDLLARAAFSEKYNADYFVSIHVNSIEDPEGTIKGFEIYTKDEASKPMAETVLKAIDELGYTTNRGILDHQNLRVITASQSKSILIELGYLSGPDLSFLKDEAKMKEYAEAIGKGIVEQLKIENK